MFAEGQEILEKRYKVIKRLGGGAFGEIYRGKIYSKGQGPMLNRYLNEFNCIVEKRKTGEHLAAKVVSISREAFRLFRGHFWLFIVVVSLHACGTTNI